MPTHLGEEKVLERLLGPCESGFYLDVGANDPHTSSNTHSFYLRGWRGIDIEPIPELAQRLRIAHPENQVVECAVGAVCGRATLLRPREFSTSELSTLIPFIAEMHRADGFGDFEGIEVQVRTLADVLTESRYRGPIDFMSLDVEGCEAEALVGLDLSMHRPRVMVIEATVPNTKTPCWDGWEPYVLSHGYDFAEFDGCNRFYVRQ